MDSNKKGFWYKYKIILIVSTVVLIFVSGTLFFFSRKEQMDIIKVGAVLPLSGKGGYYGREVRDGIYLAINEINARGGINGRKIKLIIRDSRTDVEHGIEVFREIERKHNPLFYISALSLNSMALAPVAEKNEVVLFGLVTSARGLTEGREWVFRYYPMANDEVSIALRILEELRIDSLGILYSDEDYGRSVTNIFNTEFIKKSGKTRSEPLPLESRDFREQVIKVKDMDAVYVVGYPHHFKFVFKELSRQNFKGYKLAASTASRPSAVKLPQNDGVYVSAPKIYDPDFLCAKEVGEKYEARFGRPFNHFAANGYDIVKIIGGLLEDEEINRVNLRNLLEEGFIYPGIFGTISVKKAEHNMGFPLYPAQIVDGKLKYWW